MALLALIIPIKISFRFNQKMQLVSPVQNFSHNAHEGGLAFL